MQETHQIALVSKAAMEHFGERSTLAAACGRRITSGSCSPIAFIVPLPYMRTAFKTAIEAFKWPFSTAAARSSTALLRSDLSRSRGCRQTSARRR